jgi:hypothetical protein
MVTAINRARHMGILLKELLGRENVTENCVREWLRQNPGKLAEQQTPWLMNFVRVSNKVQGELKLFADAPREVVQMTMQCAGLLPPTAEREGAQASHELTPSVQAWKLTTDLKVKIETMMKSAPQWDSETRADVVANMEKTRQLMADCIKKLNSLPPAHPTPGRNLLPVSTA